jgi:hypothetical protein
MSLTLHLAWHTGPVVDILAQTIGPSAPEAPPGAEKFTRLLSWLMWGAILASVAAGIIAGAMLGWQRYQGGGGGEAESKLAKVLIGAIVIAVIGGVVNTLALG